MLNEPNFSDLKINLKLLELLEKNNFKMMKPVQASTIPDFLKKDVVVQSQTGSGKTLAFLIPIFNKILDSNADKKTQSLIIVPTRELALQIKDVADLFEFKALSLIGGLPIEDDIINLDKDNSIVVATPGRLFEVISLKKTYFSKIKYLVIDECDKLFGADFEGKIIKILELLPKNKITGLFSATIDENVTRLSVLSQVNTVQIRITNQIPENLSIQYKFLQPSRKLEELAADIKDKKSIVFFATCNSVDFFHALFSEADTSMFYHKIHGKIDQKRRNEVYEKFQKSGGTLFCTDVAARGIDFKDIELVVHFDVPKDYTNVIHRSGRTARNGELGISIMYLMNNEKPFLEFLKLKNIESVQSYNKNSDSKSTEKNPSINDNRADIYYDRLKSIMNDQLLGFAVKAFVSYVRSYQEHVLNFILNFKELDFDEIAKLFFLIKIPQMSELRNIKFKNFEKPDGVKKRRIR